MPMFKGCEHIRCFPIDHHLGGLPRNPPSGEAATHSLGHKFGRGNDGLHIQTFSILGQHVLIFGYLWDILGQGFGSFAQLQDVER
jgi:hypothetical protein